MPNTFKRSLSQVVETRHAFCQISDYGRRFSVCQSCRTDRRLGEEDVASFSASEVLTSGVKTLSVRCAAMNLNSTEHQKVDDSLQGCCCLLCGQTEPGLSHGDVVSCQKLKTWSYPSTKSLKARRTETTCQAVRSRNTAVGEAYDVRAADMNHRSMLIPAHLVDGLKEFGTITQALKKDEVKYRNLAAALRFKRLLTLGNQDDFTLQEPVGIAANSDGVIAVTDFGDDLIRVFSKQGSLIREINHYEKSNGKKLRLLCPTGIAFDSFGNLVVIERGRHRVTVMTPQGKLLRGFGRRGKADGQLWLPHGVSVDSHDRIIVTDTGNSRVQVFNLEGKLILVFGNSGEHKLDYPCYALFHESFFYVSDTDNDCVKVFDSEGKFVRIFTDVDHSERSCRFSAPSGLAVFKDKYLLVCDYNNDCVKACTLDGVFVAKFGTSGKEVGQFSGPEALVVLPDGEVGVTDKKNHRLHVFSQMCNKPDD